MADERERMYEYHKTELQRLYDEVALTKRMINKLCKDMGKPVEFEDTETERVGSQKIAPDLYFRKPLSTAVVMYLSSKGNAVEIPEIIEALRAGGNEIAKSTADEELKESIIRNTTYFQKVGDAVGLKEWYKPEQKKRGRPKTKSEASTYAIRKLREVAQEKVERESSV